MPRTFSLSNKALSLWGRINVNDENDVPIYQVKGEFAILEPIWHIMEGEREIGSIMRNVTFWLPTWDVNLNGRSFRIKRKILAWTRTFYADGGPYAGAEVTGDFFGLKYEISHDGRLLARAQTKVLSLRDKHVVTMASDKPEDEVFVLAAMLALQLDGKEGGDTSSTADDA